MRHMSLPGQCVQKTGKRHRLFPESRRLRAPPDLCFLPHRSGDVSGIFTHTLPGFSVSLLFSLICARYILRSRCRAEALRSALREAGAWLVDHGHLAVRSLWLGGIHARSSQGAAGVFCFRSRCRAKALRCTGAGHKSRSPLAPHCAKRVLRLWVTGLTQCRISGWDIPDSQTCHYRCSGNPERRIRELMKRLRYHARYSGWPLQRP